MRYSVETWAPEYGVAADATQLEESAGTIRPDVEVPVDRWSPIEPPATSAVPERILFVDGVRRIEARVWFEDESVVRPGVCASVAGGSVLTAGGVARLQEVVIHRGFFARSARGAESIVTRHGTYEYVHCAGDAADDIYFGIHRRMTAIESQVATHHDADLVVFDGPLRHRKDPLSVGYVKTQHVQYLADAQQVVVSRLRAGQRTPLFLIEGAGARLSWYVRLPGPRSQPLSGVVRVEMPIVGAPAAASARADGVTLALQRFASEAHKDARAPQNLYPIAGLEQRLRHLLGDQHVLERALRRASHPDQWPPDAG